MLLGKCMMAMILDYHICKCLRAWHLIIDTAMPATAVQKPDEPQAHSFKSCDTLASLCAAIRIL